MNAIVEKLEKSMLRTDIPVFKPGDTIKVHVRVKEGEKERTQLYEGIVIARRASGMRETSPFVGTATASESNVFSP